jgi:hypothetical protein
MNETYTYIHNVASIFIIKEYATQETSMKQAARRTVSQLSMDYMTLYPRRWNSSQPPLREPQTLHGSIQFMLHF